MSGDLKGAAGAAAGALIGLLVVSAAMVHGRQLSRESAQEGAAARDRVSASFSPEDLVPLESTVDPALYAVGPADILSVNIWTTPPLNFQLPVTPEGTLIVPTVGEIRVADQTLEAARSAVLAGIRKKYVSASATVTLIVPRRIIVLVTGNVLYPGTYEMRSTDRVDRAIEKASRREGLNAAGEATPAASVMSRNISLKRKEGASSRVDIRLYYATKKGEYDPFLREGDVIFVPQTNMERNVIGVYGEVNIPGTLEFVEGDSLTHALQLAYGCTPAARTDSVELSRLDAAAKSMAFRFVDLRAIQAGSSPDIRLEPGDRIVVRSRPEVRGDFRVKVSGEVVDPGVYPITKDKTRLTEVVRRAGGFREDAAVSDAELLRHSVSPEDVDVERLLSLRGSISPEDSAYYHLETNLRLRKEVVNVDFGKLFLENDSTQDVLLRSEDEIIVPSVRRTVYVFGEVVVPGHIPFVPGEGTAYYTGKAGGFTEEARPGDVRVIKERTKQWLPPEQTVIEAGDYIWVPKEPYHPFPYYTAIVRDIASSVGAFLGLAILVSTLSK